MTPEEIFAEAYAASNAAAHAYARENPPTAFDCGFAWTTIRPARGAFVEWLKVNDKGHKHYGGGYDVWYSHMHDVPTQSVSVHEAAAKAFAATLRAHGINATWDSRLD